MLIDPRLNEIDDCLYRVSVRVLIAHEDKVLMVQEFPQMWWAFPGGGVDHGENVRSALTREVEEELGVPAGSVSSDFKIAHYNLSGVVDGIPRMNLFFKATVPIDLLKKTSHVAKWSWFTKDEFLKLDIVHAYDKPQLMKVIFDDYV